MMPMQRLLTSVSRSRSLTTWFDFRAIVSHVQSFDRVILCDCAHAHGCGIVCVWIKISVYAVCQTPEQQHEYTSRFKSSSARQCSTLVGMLAHPGTLQSLQPGPLKDRAHKARLNMNYISQAMRSEAASDVVDRELQPNDVMISVSFHDFDKCTKTQEFLIVGTQTLANIRDRIYCLEDIILCGPETPSAYFLIEGTFYSDTREAKAIDYSEEIAKLFPGVFQQKLMQTTRMVDLNIVIGRQYLFCHQGNHEHWIVFNSVRFPGATDEKNLQKYPIHMFQSKPRLRKCCTCLTHVAKFVCYDDRLAVETPCFFCDKCYSLLHYDTEGHLLYSDFKVFPYFHD
eukprot:c18738_g1_i1.p1 GENE.c18738_g1_i1~~c18738_g1_i1.p1  ORF type:complete len:342 (-),score=67.44 c18738_g1_i1:167-1192(-)